MSKDLEDIKDQLGKFAAKHGPTAIIPVTVTAINEDDTVAVEFSDDSVIDDVRLRSVVKDGNKVLIIPTVGSVVLVGRIENSEEYVVLAVEEISEIKYVIGDTTFSMTDAGFLIQRGTETNKKLLQDILSRIEELTVPTNTGPSGVPLNKAAFTAIKNRVQNLFR